MSNYVKIYFQHFSKEIISNEAFLKDYFLNQSSLSVRYNNVFNDLNRQILDRKGLLEKQIENNYPGCIGVFEAGRKKYSKDEVQNAILIDLKSQFDNLKNCLTLTFEELIKKIAIRDADYETMLILNQNYNNYESLYEGDKLDYFKLLRIDENPNFAAIIEKVQNERYGVKSIVQKASDSSLEEANSKIPTSNSVLRLRSDIKQLDFSDKCILLHCCYLSLNKLRDDFKLTEFIRIVSICDDIYDDKYFLNNAQNLTTYKKISQGIDYSKVSIPKKRERIDNLISKIENLSLDSTINILKHLRVNLK